MRARLLVLLLAGLALALSACGNDGDGDAAEDDPGDQAAGDVELEEGELNLEEPPDLGEAADLSDGVAGIVDGAEIPTETVEGRFEAFSVVPQMAEQLEGEDGDRLAETYRAQILQNLIIHRVVADGAEELGVAPSEEQIEAVEQQAMADFQGEPEEFADAMQAEGVSEEQLQEEFEFAARVEAVREEVADEVDPEDLEAGEELELDPTDLALQQWFGERLEAADIKVDEEYGIWNPEMGEVVPMSLLEESE